MYIQIHNTRTKLVGDTDEKKKRRGGYFFAKEREEIAFVVIQLYDLVFFSVSRFIARAAETLLRRSEDPTALFHMLPSRFFGRYIFIIHLVSSAFRWIKIALWSTLLQRHGKIRRQRDYWALFFPSSLAAIAFLYVRAGLQNTLLRVLAITFGLDE